jgi:hypothetical protein
MLAITLGFVAAPLLEVLDGGLPPGLGAQVIP